MILKKKQLAVRVGQACAAIAIAATAQSAWAETTQRVEVTGSAIRRIDAESSVPVTILKVDDLKNEGVTSVEQIMTFITASQSSTGTSQSVGSGTGGAAYADLRGVGRNKTLVLLNGRRMGNNALDGSAVDLNMIPFAALERVEVLRDSASSLYGTDAIGGVINFITRTNFTGGTVTVGANSPQHPGANQTNANVGFGYGDLQTDHFNVFGFLDYQKQDPLRASQRGDINQRSLKTSPTTALGQYNQGGAVENPGFPGCNPDGIPLGNGVTGKNCGYLYARKVDLVPETERKSAYVKGTLQFTPENKGSLEYFNSNAKTTTLVAGVPYGALWMNPGTPFYPGNGITPAPTVFALDPTYLPSTAPAGALPGVIKLRWRDAVSGGREGTTDNTQQRLVAAVDGAVLGWDYRVGFTWNENKIKDKLTGGYTDGTIITPAVRNGIINPFGAQNAAGSAAITAAAANGTLQNAKGTVYGEDVQISRELSDWFGAGRASTIAFGAEHRNEKFKDVANAPFAALVVNSTGFDPATNNQGDRNVEAVYTEVNVPVTAQLEFTGSVRYDHYSDAGGTTNPKIAFRYQPTQQILVRGSFSEGFRAPSLYELNAPQTYTNTANPWDDPVRCPNGTPIPGVSPSDNCAVQFMSLAGGNPNLKPETSEVYTLGLVFEPTSDMTFSVDYWNINIKDSIGALPDTTIFGDPTKYSSLFLRAPDGSLSTDGSLCPGANCGYVLDTTSNLGGIKTYGLDVSGNYRLRTAGMGTFNFGLNGTYVDSYKYQNEKGGVWNKNVGIYSGAGPIFRWQSTSSVSWNLREFSAGVVNHYKTSYDDQDPTSVPYKVDSLSTWDAYGNWKPTKSISLTVGVLNLTDKAPPNSNQSATFQVGYDPRYADAVGRTYYARANYTF